MGRRLVLLPLLGLLALGYAAKCPKQRTSPGREILCYTTTSDVASLADSICRCTTVVHQGHDLKDLSASGIEDFQKSLKEMNPTLQVVLSVSDAEGSLKTSARTRQEAAARIVRILNEVDGIELNVTAGTKERLVHFVQGLKTELVRKSKDKRILLVLPTRPEDLAKQFDLKALSKYVDLFTLPTHYLVDDEEAFRTFHPSRLMGLFDMLNTDSLVDLVIGLGAGKRKILVSLPASAYKFALEKNEENAPRAAAKGKLPVQISRSEMCETMDVGEWIVERDEDLTAPYGFKDDTWLAFEDKISAGIKGKYVLLRDLAGLGIHNVEMDSKTKCGDSLTEDVYHAFTDNKRKTREAVLTSLQEDLQQTDGPYSGHIKSSDYRIVRVVDTDGHIHAMRENLQTEFSCPHQGYFVHPKSCNRFYRCVKFNQGIDDYSVFEFDCPAGLAFDEHAEVCVWPGSISACSGSSEIAPSKGPKFTCPDHPGYYADPHNCRFFYACYDLGEHELTAYEFRCPYGLVFDEKKLICEWPYLVPSCGGGVYERDDYGGHGGAGHGGHEGHGGSDQGGHGGYGGGDQGGHGGYGGGDQGGHGGHGGGDQGGHGGHGGGDQGGHGGYGGGNQGGHGGYGGGDQGGHGGHGGGDQGGHGGYGGGDQGGHGGHGGGDQGGHGGHGGGDQGGHGGYGGGDQGGHGGYGGGDQGGHGGHGGGDQGGHGGHGGGDQGVHGGHGGSDQGGHGGYGGGDHGGHGGYGGGDQGGHGGHGGGDQGVHGGHGGSDQGGHGGYGGGNQGGHAGHGGGDQGGHGGHGGSDQGGHGGYGGGDQGGHGGQGGGDQGGHGGYGGGDQGGHGGHGGGGQGGHGGYGGGDQGGHGGHGGGDQGGHGGHGGGDQGGHGGHGGGDQGGHGGSGQGGHGGYGGGDQGGHGGAGQGGHGGYGGGDQGGHGGYGGGNQGGHGGGDLGGHGGYGGGNQGGHGGADQGGHGGYGGGNQGGHGGGDQGGHGGYGGGTQGGHGGIDQGGHGGYGGGDEGGHGGAEQGGHGGYGGGNQGGHGGYGGGSQGGHGGADQGGGHGGYGGGSQGGHGGADQGGHGGHVGGNQGGHGGADEGGHGGHGGGRQDGHGGYGGGDESGHESGHGGVDQGGHGGYGDGDQGGHGGADAGGHGGHGDQHGGSSDGGHAGSYTTQGGYTQSHYGAGGAKGSYGTSTQGGYTNFDAKYPVTPVVGHTPAPGIGIFTSPGGYAGHTTISSSSGHHANEGFTTIDTGVHTGITAGGFDGHIPTVQYGGHTPTIQYGGHTPTIQYGGHTRPAVTYDVEETTPHSASGYTGSTTYHGNFGSTGGHVGSGYTDSGSGISAGIKTGSYGGSRGATTYHGNFGSTGYVAGGSTGSISSGAASQGVIGTGDSTSGTVYAQGDVAGSVSGGSSEQGGIITGITQPGYVQTQSGKPGYVVTNGVKTVYDGSATKGTFHQGVHGDGAVITGAPTPGVVLTGDSSPGTFLVGQTSPGVIVGGGVTPGVTVGDRTDGGYYTGGSGTSIYNGAGGSRGKPIFTSSPKTPYYPNNPFLGQSSPAVGVGGGVTSAPSYSSTGGGYYTGGSGTSIYHGAGGSGTSIYHGAGGSGTSVYSGAGGPGTSVYHGAGGSGTSVYHGAGGSTGQTTFTGATNGFPQKPITSVSGDSGYKTNEYHDNGGRSTIRYNNGEITHKFTEDDVRDHKTQFGTYPTFDVGSYEASTAGQAGSFTKTGPTKTGIVTAQVGGSGSYVAGSTTKPRPFATSQNIGPNAFGSSKTSNSLSYGTSTTSAPSLSYTSEQTNYDAGSVDVSKIDLGHTSGQSSSGYSYTKPAIQLNTFGVTGSTQSPIFSGHKTTGYSTTSAPFLDVHVYNSPSVVTSAPITASPAVVNTYYPKPSSVEYGSTVYKSPNGLPSATGAASTGTYRRPIVVTDQRKFPSVSSTVAPIGFTTGPLENFKTTVFQAAGIPASVSTVRPVIDTGYKTVVSSTPLPIGVHTDGRGYSQSTVYRTGSSSANGDIDVPADIGSSGYSTSKSRRPSITQSITYRPTVQKVTYESTGSAGYSESSDYNDYSHTQSSGTFGQRVTQGVSVTPAVYNVPSSTLKPAIGVTYREPFQIQSTPRPTPQSRVPFDGYTYSKPSVKFVTSTASSISYKPEVSYNTKAGGSPTNPDIPRTEVQKLVTNYDRGSAKYTPSGYESYSDLTANGRDESSSYTNRYSGQEFHGSTKTSSIGKSQSGVYNNVVYSTTPGYQSSAQNFGHRVQGTSGYGVTNSNLEVKGGSLPSTTYLPTFSSPSPGRKFSSSSPRPPAYSSTTPAVTTYSGGYSRGPTTPSYEAPGTGVDRPKGKGKVIVKFSDLHPLLLGKLGAECTCKADPFASFRGSKPLPIDSSKGRVDLRNYDESEIYVDLESSKENGDYDDGEYHAYSEDSTPANYDDGRYETPVVAVFNGVTPSSKGALKSRGPSANYQSGSSSTSRPSPSSTYLPSAALSNRGAVKASFPGVGGSVSASFTSARGGGFRAGKNLGDSPAGNALIGQGASFDRFGPGGLRDADETLQGTSDCTRPGLFRHPNFCNKFYACHWDEWKKKFTLHVFNCPIHLTFDGNASACNWPSKGPACQDDNLLV